MPTSSEVAQADSTMAFERRIASLESTLSTLLANGLKDMLTAHGDQEFGGGVARLDSHGMQIVKVGAGLNYDPSIFFQDKFSSAPSSDGRLALIRGLKAGNTDGTTLFISMGVRDADGDSAVVNVDNSIDGRPTVMLQSTESGVRTTYLALSAFFDEISVGGVLNLDDKGANPSTFAALPDGGYIWFDGTNDKFRGRLNSANYNFLLEGDASGMNKVTGSGYLVYPPAASGIDPANSGVAWSSGAWSQVVASTAQAVSIIGIIYGWDDLQSGETLAEAEIELGTGAAAAEVAVSVIPAIRQRIQTDSSIGIQTVYFPAPIEVATATRIAVRVRSSSTTSEPNNIRLIYAKASELVSR